MFCVFWSAMNLSLDLQTPVRHPFRVTEPTDTATEMRLLGQALAMLRESIIKDDGSVLTQEEAGERVFPKFTRQAWHAHEAGKIKGILTPDVQRRLMTALGMTPEALRLARDQIAAHGETYRAAAKVNSGLKERAGLAFANRDTLQAVFPTADGAVLINYPAKLTAAGV